MPLIHGTRFGDSLIGTIDTDTIEGRRGDDQILASSGDTAFGGIGNDIINTEPIFGADDLPHTAAGVTLIGGAGNDDINAFGILKGGIGDDRLTASMYFDTDTASLLGGRGADTFAPNLHADGHVSHVDILDFAPGRDHLEMWLHYTQGTAEAGFLTPAQIFGVLDTNGDGTLGNDVPWDANSGVTVDSSSLTIRVHEDTVTLHGVTALTAADWQF